MSDDTKSATPALAVQIRDATPADMPMLHAMIFELAEYEGVPDGPKLSVQDLIEDGFRSSPPWFFALVAELEEPVKDRAVLNAEGKSAGDRIVGWALCNRAYSSWTRRAFYLEDFYVRPQYRRAGMGIKLIKRLCEMALKEDVHRIDWHVLASNDTALSFYRRIGAVDLRETEGRLALRLHREEIEHVVAKNN